MSDLKSRWSVWKRKARERVNELKQSRDDAAFDKKIRRQKQREEKEEEERRRKYHCHIKGCQNTYSGMSPVYSEFDEQLARAHALSIEPISYKPTGVSQCSICKRWTCPEHLIHGVCIKCDKFL